ncbi:MAG: hypothetical protein ACI9DS_001875 [Glaciecola sp.]|jgi:hypothetical protein
MKFKPYLVVAAGLFIQGCGSSDDTVVIEQATFSLSVSED